jgi:alpha,alpha-trehalase
MRGECQKCLAYINRYWKKATFNFPKDDKVHIGLPNRYVSPNASRFGRDQFYWDSYFIILGLVESGQVKLAKGMVDNFLYLLDKLGFIPVRNIFINLAISQPPFLTSMALEIFRHDGDKKWLKRVAAAAETELCDYWQDKCGTAEKWPLHLLPGGLSRYAGSYRTSFLAEYESGWDETSRFDNRCLDFAAIDLNSLLYKYENDLAVIYGILGDNKKQKSWKLIAKKRRALIDEYCYDKGKGFYFDYDQKKGKKSKFWSMAGFYPLWAGLASEEQAAKIVKNLKRFEFPHGLANTQRRGLSKPYKQWDWPNGWPNQQWIAIDGLLKYGYREDAQRLAQKWLSLNTKIFKETGKMWEKYDVVKGKIGKADYRYETQEGFGWTNAVFLRLYKEFDWK